ncbi:uncharacterized protein P7C70_g1040, partial [Phenoliferia sp. Uapishka_3]
MRAQANSHPCGCAQRFGGVDLSVARSASSPPTLFSLVFSVARRRMQDEPTALGPTSTTIDALNPPFPPSHDASSPAPDAGNTQLQSQQASTTTLTVESEGVWGALKDSATTTNASSQVSTTPVTIGNGATQASPSGPQGSETELNTDTSLAASNGLLAGDISVSEPSSSERQPRGKSVDTDAAGGNLEAQETTISAGDSSIPESIIISQSTTTIPHLSVPASSPSLTSSSTSTPILGGALLLPPTPSGSPAPPKKFTSNLINKKFLEKAGEKSKPDVKATVARLATPPVVVPVSTSHPRLLTGKISAGTSVSLTTAQTLTAPSGWLKNTIAAGADGTARPPLPSQADAAGLGRGATYERGRGGIMGGGQLGRGRGAAVWGGKASLSGGELNMGIGGDFPTAAEAANGTSPRFPLDSVLKLIDSDVAKNFRAQALLEQMQSRDRAVQARAAAAAAANAHLLEGLDAFRGVHLDPNASHWDDDGEDTDFLDDTIEFGDGTQYKIEDARPPPPPSAAHGSHYIAEPHPADFATLEAPLAPGESAEHQGEREERFKDDFDRSWPKRPVVSDQKSIFNERLGKFEPFSGAAPGAKRPPGPIPVNDERARVPSGSEHSNASVTSPRLDKAPMPSTSARREPPAGAWGRSEQVRVPEWSHGAGSAPAPRRPSIDQQPRLRRPSEEPTSHRPNLELGGRQLPPHLAAAAANAPTPRAHHDPSNRPAGPPPPHHSLPSSHPPPPALTLVSPPQPAKALPQQEPVAQVAPPPPAVQDLEELHTREMHAAAERAKKRRQEEEQLRAEQVERAKKKAAELEEKLRLAAEAKALEAAAKAPPPPPMQNKAASTLTERTILRDPSGRPALQQNGLTAERADYWRERTTKPSPIAAPSSLPPSSIKPEPTQILSRDPKPPAGADRPVGTMMADTLPSAQSPSIGTRPSTVSAPVEDRVWRRGDEVPSSSRFQEPTRATTRQLPPHIAAQHQSAASALADSPLPKLPPSPLSPITGLVQQQSSMTPQAPVDHPLPSTVGTENGAPPPTTSPSEPSPQDSRKASAGAISSSLTIKGGYKKIPPISTLEDTMSRIKVAMALPMEPVRDPVETVSHEVKSPLALPTVKLPTTTLSLATALADIAVKVPPPSFSGSSKLDQRLPSPANKQTPVIVRGRPDTKRVAHAPPAFESREAMPLFDRSRVERSVSPAPAWKAYVVRLATYPKLSTPRYKMLKGFSNPREPSSVHTTTLTQPSKKDRSYPSYFKNKTLHQVRLTSKRITRKTSIELFPVSAFAPPPQPAETSSRAPDGSWRRNNVSPSAESVSMSDEVEEVREHVDMLDATTAPPAASLFDPGPPRHRTVKEKVPPGESIAFYRAPAITPLERVNSSKMFMVTSELDGEVVEQSPREYLAAPGADVTVQAPELGSSSTPPFEVVETSPSTQTLSAPSNGSWPTKSPLTMSVLDPTVPSVWSAPPTDSPVHARSISLGGIQPENSLQGIADPDDFPAASIPTSLAELKSEDEGSVDGKPIVQQQQQAAKDEARLRAAAPSFSTYNELPSPLAEARAPRYPAFTRTPSYPQLPPSQSPVNYTQAFLPSTSYGQAPPPHLYPSYPSQSLPSVPSYGSPMHQNYNQSAFGPSNTTPTSPFSSYRPANTGNTITNPALIAAGYGSSNYGPIGAFGPVGGSGGPRNSEDPTLFTAAGLAQFDAIAFLSNSNVVDDTGTVSQDVLDSAGVEALRQWLTGPGKGLVGLHAATACLFDDESFGVGMGSWFDVHPEIQNATFLKVVEHPVVDMLPERYTTFEEVYNFRSDPRSVNATVVLTVDETSYDNTVTNRPFFQGSPHPIAWVRDTPVDLGNGTSNGKMAGRLFMTSLGHTNATWQSPLHLAHVEAGFKWVIEGTLSNASSSEVKPSSIASGATRTLSATAAASPTAVKSPAPRKFNSPEGLSVAVLLGGVGAVVMFALG